MWTENVSKWWQSVAPVSTEPMRTSASSPLKQGLTFPWLLFWHIVMNVLFYNKLSLFISHLCHRYVWVGKKKCIEGSVLPRASGIHGGASQSVTPLIREDGCNVYVWVWSDSPQGVYQPMTNRLNLNKLFEREKKQAQYFYGVFFKQEQFKWPETLRFRLLEGTHQSLKFSFQSLLHVTDFTQVFLQVIKR